MIRAKLNLMAELKNHLMQNKVSMLNIPMHKPVKPTYVDQVRERIMEIEGESEQ